VLTREVDVKRQLDRLSIGEKLTALSFVVILFALFTFVAVSYASSVSDGKSLSTQGDRVLQMMETFW
jgi:CHASE3 domain sensor protein